MYLYRGSSFRSARRSALLRVAGCGETLFTERFLYSGGLLVFIFWFFSQLGALLVYFSRNFVENGWVLPYFDVSLTPGRGSADFGLHCGVVRLTDPFASHFGAGCSFRPGCFSRPRILAAILVGHLLLAVGKRIAGALSWTLVLCVILDSGSKFKENSVDGAFLVSLAIKIVVLRSAGGGFRSLLTLGRLGLSPSSTGAPVLSVRFFFVLCYIFCLLFSVYSRAEGRTVVLDLPIVWRLRDFGRQRGEGCWLRHSGTWNEVKQSEVSLVHDCAPLILFLQLFSSGSWRGGATQGPCFGSVSRFWDIFGAQGGTGCVVDLKLLLPNVRQGQECLYCSVFSIFFSEYSWRLESRRRCPIFKLLQWCLVLSGLVLLTRVVHLGHTCWHGTEIQWSWTAPDSCLSESGQAAVA